MARIFEMVSPSQQLELALQSTTPTQIASKFAAYAGQFYDRSAFDAMARQVHDLYATTSDERADRFRIQLDRRLCDRYHEPVVWDTGLADLDRSA